MHPKGLISFCNDAQGRRPERSEAERQTNSSVTRSLNYQVVHYSTHQAAKKLGVTQAALSKYFKAKKVPAPKMVTSGKMTLHLWTEAEIEHVRKLLPKIANGRKTRYQKLRAAHKKGAQKQKVPTKKPVPRKRKPKNTKS